MPVQFCPILQFGASTPWKPCRKCSIFLSAT